MLGQVKSAISEELIFQARRVPLNLEFRKYSTYSLSIYHPQCAINSSSSNENGRRLNEVFRSRILILSYDVISSAWRLRLADFLPVIAPSLHQIFHHLVNCFVYKAKKLPRYQKFLSYHTYV